MTVNEPPARDAAPASDEKARRDGVRKNLRGSSLLLSGRFLSLGINLAVQVLTVRYLVREDYGMFAYALAVVAMATNVVLLGLDKTLARFVAVYFEKKDYPRVFGSIFAAGFGISAASLLIIGTVLLASGSLPRLLNAEPQAIRLLVVLIAIAPLQGFDSTLHALFSVFSSARAIVIRRYLVAPGLKLGSVLLVVGLGGGAYELALAYVLSMAAGVAVYAAYLAHVLRRDGHFAAWGERRLSIPWRILSGYALSLVGAEILFMFYNSFVTMVLEYHHGPSEVAGFGAARPFARLNDVVLVAFIHLFIPMLARFFARKDDVGIQRLYVQTSLFITLLSFPLFAVTFGTADSLAAFLLGAEYADAGRLLAWMSLGFFVQAALGVNSHALRVLGHVKTAVAVDVTTIAVATAASLFWIPRHGAMGAAATVALVVAIKGVFSLAALHRRTGLHPCRDGQASTYVVVGVAAAVIVAARPFVAESFWLSALVSAAATAIVVGFVRRRLDLSDLFPELTRLPLLSRLLGARPAA